jgi:hypothetical protein
VALLHRGLSRSQDSGGYVESYYWKGLQELTLLQPFNAEYHWFNTTDNLIIPNDTTTQLNEYQGGVFQQATSSLTLCSKFS